MSNSSEARVSELHNVVPQIVFFTFGMFIIDEIEFLDQSQPSKTDLPGGAGLYCLLGARLLCPPPYSFSLSWILDAGNDFPHRIASQIKSWQTSTLIRYDNSRSTTRAWNGYGEDEKRDFKYLTPKRRLDVEDLDDAQITGKGWHMVCSPSRCMDIVDKLCQKRKALGIGDGHGNRDQVVIWEPIPDLCTPAELERLKSAAGMVDVVSPNAEELRSFFGVEGKATTISQDELVAKLMGWDDQSKGASVADDDTTTTISTACIIREGKDGSTVYLPPGWYRSTPNSSSTSKSRLKINLPAYHTSTTSHRVTDPTGGGNTYLGTLAVSMAYTNFLSASTTLPIPKIISHVHNLVTKTFQQFSHPDQNNNSSSSTTAYISSILTSSILACIAASFAIEQNGVPDLIIIPAKDDNDNDNDNKDTVIDDEEEQWGPPTSSSSSPSSTLSSLLGTTVSQRVDIYLAREWSRIESQIRDLFV